MYYSSFGTLVVLILIGLVAKLAWSFYQQAEAEYRKEIEKEEQEKDKQ